MATVRYTVAGTFTPFSVELRENDVNGAIIDSQVANEAGTFDFLNVVTPANYVVVVHDSVGGQSQSTTLQATTTTTTTTTTTSTTTTTTTAAPATTTTTTEAPCTLQLSGLGTNDAATPPDNIGIDFNVNSGVPPYQIELSGFKFFTETQLMNADGFGLFSGLRGNTTYTLTATDAAGCIEVRSVTTPFDIVDGGGGTGSGEYSFDSPLQDIGASDSDSSYYIVNVDGGNAGDVLTIASTKQTQGAGFCRVRTDGIQSPTPSTAFDDFTQASEQITLPASGEIYLWVSNIDGFQNITFRVTLTSVPSGATIGSPDSVDITAFNLPQ